MKDVTGEAALADLIEQVAGYFEGAERVTVLSGAGVSKESGIPTFRNAQTGLWANYDPGKLATCEGFLADPPLVWRWYDHRRKLLEEARPNPGHLAIAELERYLPHVTVVTQNIDGLHQLAGSSDVVELHGSIKRFFCFDNRHEVEDVEFGLEEPPSCSVCGSLIRPGVVWFGEALPSMALNRAMAECENSQVLLVVGTSGLVQPAASLPVAGLMKGARVVEVNPDETPLTEAATAFLKGPSGRVLPLLVERVKALLDG